ncbi:MAG: hypothetical protein AAF481_11695 [Acidobacteriota bacterium]
MKVEDSMSVEQLNVLHRRYVSLSQRFRAAWVFHQFLQSLAKLFFEGFDDRYPAEFQHLYGRLKDISQNLNASEAGGLANQMDAVDRQLRELMGALLAEDSRVDPSFLRQFFMRFRKYDEKILMQLVRFYLYSHPGEAWQADRIDKIDFLLSRMGEEESDGKGPVRLRDRRRLEEVYRNLRSLLPGSPKDPEVVVKRRQRIQDLAEEVTAIDDLDKLNEERLVQRYRTLKHSLGELFFEPEMLMAMVEANLAFKNKVRDLYSREERRIFTDYQQIFDLERQVETDASMESDLDQLRSEVERFEEHLQRDDLRLDDLAHIRKRVRSLMPRLSPSQAEAPDLDAVALDPFGRDEEDSAAAQPDLAPAEAVDDDGQWVAEHLERLIEALSGTTLGAPPKAVSLTPDVFHLALEEREVVAFRNLLQADRLHARSGGGGDAQMDRFILRAAALRQRLAEELERVRETLDDTVVDGTSPVAIARTSVRIADEMLGRFESIGRNLVRQGRAQEARGVELLKMRLMREYVSLWLLVYRDGASNSAATES